MWTASASSSNKRKESLLVSSFETSKPSSILIWVSFVGLMVFERSLDSIQRLTVEESG